VQFSTGTLCSFQPVFTYTPVNSIDVESLISKNRENLVFLHFWPEMSYSEFMQVLKLEEKNGYLKDGKFILEIPKKSETVSTSIDINSIYNLYNNDFEVHFDVKKRDNAIVLRYNHDYWVKMESNVLPSSIEAKYNIDQRNRRIERYLIDLFNDKYKLIEKNKYGHYDGVWFDPEMNRVIFLNASYWCVDKSRPSVSVRTRTINKKEQEVLYASGEFEITYMSFMKYSEIKRKEQNDRLKKEKEQELKKEQALKAKNALAIPPIFHHFL
jgi:hypothetical protein